MPIIVVILLAVAAILAAVAAYNPPSRFNLLAFAIAFIALALLLERWPGG